MKKSEDPEDLMIAVSFLRIYRGWNQTELAKATGIDKSRISLYEQGRKVPSRKTIDRLVKATGVPRVLFEDVLSLVRMLRVAAEDLEVDSLQIAQDIGLAVAASLKLAVYELLVEIEREDEEDPFLEEPAELARAEAEGLWEALQHFSPQDRRFLVKEGREYRKWALVERLCDESDRTTSDDPIEALELAELALQVAARVPGHDAWRCRLQGYAWAFVGDARRTAGDAAGAEAALRRARELWDAAVPENVTFLDESRFRKLQAS